ncbi:unnamed protein product [Brassica rapa subsp. narinosa]
MLVWEAIAILIIISCLSFTPLEDGTFTHNKLLILSMGTTTSSI